MAAVAASRRFRQREKQKMKETQEDIKRLKAKIVEYNLKIEVQKELATKLRSVCQSYEKYPGAEKDVNLQMAKQILNRPC